MKSYKTSLVGLLLAVIVAIQPIVEGTGYHLDAASTGKLIFAGLLAALGFMSKDHDITGK